jgi:hypothetical protein
MVLPKERILTTLFGEANTTIHKNMNKDQKTIRIYTGPTMIASGLIARLNEEGISPIVKDDHNSGITGGFSTGIPNQVRLFIRNEQLDTAKTMINEYFAEVGEPLL